jgi:hypothetical protein
MVTIWLQACATDVYPRAIHAPTVLNASAVLSGIFLMAHAHRVVQLVIMPMSILSSVKYAAHCARCAPHQHTAQSVLLATVWTLGSATTQTLLPV